MMISSLNPSLKNRMSPTGGDQASTSNMKIEHGGGTVMVTPVKVQDPIINKKFQKPEMAEIAVTTVDPRSMIPSQSGRDGPDKNLSPKMRGKRLSI